MVLWLGLGTFIPRGQGLIPVRGTRIPQATWCVQNIKLRKQFCCYYSLIDSVEGGTLNSVKCGHFSDRILLWRGRNLLRKLCSHRLCPLLYVKVSEIWEQRKDGPGAQVRGHCGEAPHRWRCGPIQPAALTAQIEHHGTPGEQETGVYICWVELGCVCHAKIPDIWNLNCQ